MRALNAITISTFRAKSPLLRGDLGVCYYCQGKSVLTSDYTSTPFIAVSLHCARLLHRPADPEGRLSMTTLILSPDLKLHTGRK